MEGERKRQGCKEKESESKRRVLGGRKKRNKERVKQKTRHDKERERERELCRKQRTTRKKG